MAQEKTETEKTNRTGDKCPFNAGGGWLGMFYYPQAANDDVCIRTGQMRDILYLLFVGIARKSVPLEIWTAMVAVAARNEGRYFGVIKNCFLL